MESLRILRLRMILDIQFFELTVPHIICWPMPAWNLVSESWKVSGRQLVCVRGPSPLNIFQRSSMTRILLPEQNVVVVQNGFAQPPEFRPAKNRGNPFPTAMWLPQILQQHEEGGHAAGAQAGGVPSLWSCAERLRG